MPRPLATVIGKCLSHSSIGNVVSASQVTHCLVVTKLARYSDLGIISSQNIFRNPFRGTLVTAGLLVAVMIVVEGSLRTEPVHLFIEFCLNTWW
jgi:hypothetical protein